MMSFVKNFIEVNLRKPFCGPCGLRDRIQLSGIGQFLQGYWLKDLNDG